MTRPIRFALALCLLAFPLLGFVCGGYRFPILENRLAEPIDLALHYSDGYTATGQFAPRTRIGLKRDGSELTGIDVSSGGREVVRLDAAGVARLSAETPPGQIVWAVEPDGLHPRPFQP